MSRKRALMWIGVFSIMISIYGCASQDDSENENKQPTVSPVTMDNTAKSQNDAGEVALDFNNKDYIEVTETVTTSEGDVNVTYHLYHDICYVSNPVDPIYQCMDIKVPIKIDEVDVDAEDAPIVFVNSVSDYMSATVSDDAQVTNHSTSKELTINNQLALVAGYVVVEAGCRGRDNKTEDGLYYGKAPATIVDLKAAVRYLKYNDSVMAGNANWIVSTGTGAGGAMSALLGASGNDELYDSYLSHVGAAEGDDQIFAAACYYPITDLEHADMAYEWMFGGIELEDKVVDQHISKQYQEAFVLYQESLNYTGLNQFGSLTAMNYEEYLMNQYLIPSAIEYISQLSEDERQEYLDENEWIRWNNKKAKFTFDEYVQHIGRSRSLPAFDAFDLSTAENRLFGTANINARHFTTLGIEFSSISSNHEMDGSLQEIIHMMNPMYFIHNNHPGCTDHWWIRHGTSDTNTALPVVINLATGLENYNKDVNTKLYWDAGHGDNEDAEQFIQWIADITGYKS